MTRALTSLALALLLGVAGCQSSPSFPRGETPPQFFSGMGSHTRRVTTSSPLAQRYFDQGLTFAYAFNHDEAIRSFTEAARLDPTCAMAWWGISLCHGPHINNPAMTPEASAAAWQALTQAQAAAASGGASPLERALIDALAQRYSNPPPESRAMLDENYATAMRELWRANPTDADIGCLCAEAIMDLHPWDLWHKDGSPKQDAEEVVATLEAVLRLNPEHPGANHLYIHAVEASARPERAVAAADRLRTLVPASGHLVHMPAHIDIRMGQWEQACESNRRAVIADARYQKLSPRQGFYRVYMAHNHHFLSFACMMQGRQAESLSAARDMIAGVPEEFLTDAAPLIDPYLSIELDALMRFGKWKEILALPEPRATLPITRAMWRFGRAVSLAALGRIDEAHAERDRFLEARKAVPEHAIMAINPAHKVLAIAGHMLDGEIALAEKNYDVAITALRLGAAIEDDLLYMEPPEWLHPIRHPLGAVLIQAGRYAEAEQVYREDLKAWPENGWSLFGLAKSLRQQGKLAEADAVDQRFRAAWKHADTPITSSCLCVKHAAR